MQRWHLTVGLSGAALLAALLAPRLSVRLAAPDPIAEPSEPVPAAATAHEGPPPGHLTVTAALDHTAVLAGTTSDRFLTITVSAPDLQLEATRRPIDLAVVLDASGSMSAKGKFDHAKRAAKLLASSLSAGDTYALVTFEDDATTVVPATRVHDPAAIHRAIDGIYEGGGTNLYAGLDRGAAEVRRALDVGDLGRVVVLSDGNANVGITDPTVMSTFAAGLAADGITVSTIGLGLDYNEDLLARLGDLGGGTYAFVDDAQELEAVFRDEFERSASVLARQTAVHLDLPTGVDLIEVIGWDVAADPDGWTVWMGDVYAGETRKIVARVRVEGSSEAGVPFEVASVRADYHDQIEDRLAASHAAARAASTTDPAFVAASVDKAAAAEASRAWGNQQLDLSARAYASGDVEESKRLISKGLDVLESASQQLQLPALAEEAETLRDLGYVVETYDPSSVEGKRAIKGGKELFRGRAR